MSADDDALDREELEEQLRELFQGLAQQTWPEGVVTHWIVVAAVELPDGMAMSATWYPLEMRDWMVRGLMGEALASGETGE